MKLQNDHPMRRRNWLAIGITARVVLAEKLLEKAPTLSAQNVERAPLLLSDKMEAAPKLLLCSTMPLDTLHLWREERIQASRKAGPCSKPKSFSWVILRVKSKAAIVLTLDRHTMSYQFILNSKYNLDQYSLLLDQYYLLADVILSTAVRNVEGR